MKMHLMTALLIFLLPTWGCVSVNLAKTDVTKAENLEYVAPKSPFEEFGSELIDKGWRHRKNGNAISFVSDCGNQFDPPLKNIEAGVLGGIDQKENLFSNQETYNDRASLHSLYLGQVDGIPTKVELVTFKKNGCIYVLSYVAVSSAYEQNKADFQSFLNRFKAP